MHSREARMVWVACFLSTGVRSRSFLLRISMNTPAPSTRKERISGW